MSVAVAVAIHLASELSPDLVARTLQSCEAALASDRCRLAAEPPSGDAYYATVTSAGAGAGVAHIRIVHDPGERPVADRDLSFAPEDGAGDRWASVGVVIAALITADEERHPRPVPRPVKPPPRKKTEPPHVPPPVEHHPVSFDLLGRLSHETDSRLPHELGAKVRGSLAPGDAPFFVRLEFGYTGRLDQRPSVSFPLFGAGVGFRFGPPRAHWAAEFHAMGRAEYWTISASRPGRTDSDAVWRFGAAAGVDGIWAFTRRWQAVAGAGIQVLTPRVTVDIAGATTDQVSLVGAEFVLGVRFCP